MKLKASALYYALIFSVLIAILSALLILFSFYSKTELSNYLTQQKLIENCYSGIELMKSNHFEYQIIRKDLFGDRKDSVVLVKKHWGLFDLYSSTAFSGKHKINKTALIGSQNSSYKQTALYMPNNTKALSISGETKIVGVAYLSKAGIKRTNIEGKNYIGNKLIYGKRIISNQSLPKLNSIKQDFIKKALNNHNLLNTETIEINELYSKTSIRNEFSNPTKVFKSNRVIQINNIDLSGNIILYSTKEIIIKNASNLDNILLIAPSVVIKKGTRASLQIIAKDSIIIEENVQLDYPSSLALYSKKSAFIKISSASNITGDIILNGKNSNRKKSFLDIRKNVKIEGNVYCNGIVSLKGAIYGSLFCNKFYLKTSSAIYENYLLDAVIDNSKRDKNYSSGFIFEERTIKKIVAWY